VRTAFVTGANRGIGFEITKQLLQQGDFVLAACRAPALAADLAGLGSEAEARLRVLQLDVADENSIQAAASETARLVDRVDLLYNSAGLLGKLGRNLERESRAFGELRAAALAEILAINAIGPLLVTQALMPLLRGSRVVNLTSSMGSNGLMNRGDWYGYRASKAALNMITRALSFDLRETDVIAVAMHPGWVRTTQGGEDAPYPVEENVRSMRAVVDSLKPEDSGKYLNWKGEELPW
jgi:NAD(P)-dependent dehydrogenase (short-subunit alcohol dehydrogenase family)